MLTNYCGYSGFINLYAEQTDGWKNIILRFMFIFSNMFVSAHQTIYSTNSVARQLEDYRKKNYTESDKV